MCRKKLFDCCYCETKFLTVFSASRPPWHWTSRGASTPLMRRSPARGPRNTQYSPCNATSTPHKHVSCNKSLIKPSAQQIVIAQGIIIDMMMTTTSIQNTAVWLVMTAFNRAGCPTISALLVVSCQMPPSFYICQIKSTMFTCYLI